MDKRSLYIVLMLMFLPILVQCQISKKPNIIILLADDLGYRDLSSYGSTQVQTPVIDRLASEGVRFTDFYAGSAVCSPSRASLLTGRFSVRTGVYSWIHPSQKMHLPSGEVTIAEVLKKSGYSTAHIGKWHLGDNLVEGSGPRPNPKDQGFDYWLATANNAIPSHYKPDNFVRNGKAVGVAQGYSSGIVVDETISWLNNREKSKPFFVNLWFHEPHAPVAAPDELVQKHKNTSKPAYYGSIENMDYAIGKLLDHLKKIGETDNTIVIFMSDNGSYMGQFGSNGELKNGKTTLWEGGIRVPGIIKYPGVIPAGIIENTPAGVVDIFPTICDIINVELPRDRTIDGESLMPLLSNQINKRTKPLYWFYSPSRPVAVIRDGDWSLIADPELDIPHVNLFNEELIGMIKGTALNNFRLFNLRSDPKQNTENLASENPIIFESMKAKMIELHKDIVHEAVDWRKFEW
jgi:arylsulfatase A